MWRNGRSKINARAGAGSGSVRRAVALALASAAAASSAFAQEASDNSQVMQLEDIVIVGSRLKKSGITESHNPVTVFTATDIARTGASNISDVLEYLPSKTFGPNEQNTASAALIAQLRGLTIGNTLVLINGRRTTSTASLAGAAGGTAFNLNTIPLSAVERIEILSDSASAVYGSDAVGGVVNIVLKSSISEPFVSAYYGKAEGGADERRGSAGFGYDGDRLRVSVIADYFKRDYLLGAERDQYANQDYRNQGGTDFRNTAARLANIRTQNGANLPGLNSPNATVPAGSTGVGLTPADFTATAGTTNRESLLAFASIVPASERKSAMTLAEFSFTDRLRMFGEVFYADQNDERRTNPGTIPNGTVTADQAFNPFDVPLTVQYVFPDAVVNFSENELIRGVLGLRGAITSSWDFEVYGLTSSENGAVSAANQVNAAAAAAALRSTNAATALNVFTAAPLDPAIAALVYNPRVEDQFSSDLTQASAFVRGSLFEMPAGDLSVVVGGEWRREAVHVEARALNIALTQDRDVKAGFVEARVPLVAPSMGVPLLQSVAITLAGRYDDYSDFGNTTNPQYGLEWNLVQDLLLRASYGDAYRAPSLFELYQTPTVLTLPTPDPRRNNQITNVPLTLGGNANLLPEESKTLSAGFVYTPEALRGFRTAVTYWRIKQDQRLQRPNQLTLIANEAFFPNRVVRDAPTPADIAAGLPGRLLSIDASNLNAGSLDTHGVDLEFSSTWKGRFGTFQPTLMATRVMKYDAQDFPGSPLVDRLGAANTQGAIPKTRATAGVTWTFKGFGLSPTVRYISSYDDVSTLNVKSGTRVDSQTLVDLQATLDFGAAFDENVVTKGLKLRLGVLNLTDQDAPFALVGGAQGYDPSEADLRRRFAYMTLEKSF